MKYKERVRELEAEISRYAVSNDNLRAEIKQLNERLAAVTAECAATNRKNVVMEMALKGLNAATMTDAQRLDIVWSCSKLGGVEL